MNFFRIATLLLGGFLVLNGLFILPISNFTFGIVFLFLAGLILLGYSIWYAPINAMTGILCWVRRAGKLGFLLLTVMIAFLAIYGRFDTVTYQEDAIIVLGAGLHGDVPSKTLAQRLKTAIAYHQKNPDAIIVVSGGQGFQELRPEAEAMAEYLEAHQVPSSCILQESNSASTYENFRFSKELLEKKLPGKSLSVAYITNGFHCYRAGKLAEQAGFSHPTHLHAPVAWYTWAANYLRECAAVMQLWLLHK